MCGADACKSVVLGTTKWSRIHPTDIGTVAQKEEQLRQTLWKEMLANGSTMHRVDDKTSPWDLVATVLAKGQSPALRIQRELVDMHKSLLQTEAATVLRERLQALLKELKNTGATVQVEDIWRLTFAVEALTEQGLFRYLSRCVFG